MDRKKLAETTTIVLCIIISFTILAAGCSGSSSSSDSIWKTNTDGQSYFVQPSFDSGYAEKHAFNDSDNTVRAKIDGNWKTFPLCSLDKSFLDWNIGIRMQGIKDMMAGQDPAQMFSTHDPAIATYGYEWEGSDFTLNNDIKGVGFLPRQDKIGELTLLLEQQGTAPVEEKLNTLLEIYEKFDYYFDSSKLVSLEIYTTPEVSTQTFMNQYENPVSVIVFPSEQPTYRVKAVTQLISPHDPGLDEYQKKIWKYVNLVHDFFHDPGKDVEPKTAVVYYVTELYDITPDVHVTGATKKINYNGQ